jgi:hypothetical protein
VKYFKKSKNSQQMKKLFIVLAVASLGFVACNNEASTEDAAADSARIADSIRAADSAAAAAAAALADTTHTDTLPKTDSAK